MQPKTPLFTFGSQYPPRFGHAVYLGGPYDVEAQASWPPPGNAPASQKKPHLFILVIQVIEIRTESCKTREKD